MPTPLKIFNLDEANALLERLESLLAELEAHEETFRRLHDELFFAELLGGVSLPERRLQELEKALLPIEEKMEKISALGCLLRHPVRGWVDFPAQKDQERVYYCWQRGETKIRFYHSLRGGFFERRPLI